MQPRIETLSEKKLIGKFVNMSLATNKTAELWRGFMPRRNEIKNKLTNELISMEVYNEPLRPGDMNQQFEKWAAVEVSSHENIPAEMIPYTLKGGLYAVFDYKGLDTDIQIFIYIFGTWLPNSNYVLDKRPHFQVIGEKYKKNDPESEEEIWIPIKLKE
ncbi:MAG: GyrI-like domain-containing protein [Bacteroidetes bacterium]|nr:GyrI-like domain-containing protein [Bacteroidota bacterium]